MPLKTLHSRVIATSLLTPGVMLLLVWIGRFSGSEEIARIGILQFLMWAFGAAFGIAAIVTLYVSYLYKSAGEE